MFSMFSPVFPTFSFQDCSPTTILHSEFALLVDVGRANMDIGQGETVATEDTGGATKGRSTGSGDSVTVRAFLRRITDGEAKVENRLRGESLVKWTGTEVTAKKC